VESEDCSECKNLVTDARRPQQPVLCSKALPSAPEHWALDPIHPKDNRSGGLNVRSRNWRSMYKCERTTFQFLERKLREERAALARAREQARSSFVYSPRLEFYRNYEDQNSATEINAICSVDGKVWLGEVKPMLRSAAKEIEKLLRESTKIAADKAFVFALGGDQGALHRRCDEASKAGGMEIVELYPSSWNLRPSCQGAAMHGPNDTPNQWPTSSANIIASSQRSSGVTS
jgi:hypothetical protein